MTAHIPEYTELQNEGFCAVIDRIYSCSDALRALLPNLLHALENDGLGRVVVQGDGFCRGIFGHFAGE